MAISILVMTIYNQHFKTACLLCLLCAVVNNALIIVNWLFSNMYEEHT